MSYNNIGLTTPRGSGTSGYIQRNLSTVRPRDALPTQDYSLPVKHRQPDAGILEHERKRRIENKCVELRIELEEEEKYSEAEIDERVDALRAKLQKEGVARERGSLREYETHELAAMKNAENAKFGAALGITSSHVEGEAFNRELQEQKRLAAKEERAQRQAERVIQLSKQKEAREARLAQEEALRKAREEGRRQAEREMKARMEEAEKRRRALDEQRDRDAASRDRRRSRQDEAPTRKRDRSFSPDDERDRSSRRRGRSTTRSPSPQDQARARAGTKSRSGTRSPPRRPFRESRSPPPRWDSRSRSRSRSPPRRRYSRSRSPPRRRQRSPRAGVPRFGNPSYRDHRRASPPRHQSPPRRRFDDGAKDVEMQDVRTEQKAKEWSPPPPPGFRPIRARDDAEGPDSVKPQNQEEHSQPKEDVRAPSPPPRRSRSPDPRERRASRSRSASRSDGGRSSRSGSMSMSDASD